MPAVALTTAGLQEKKTYSPLLRWSTTRRASNPALAQSRWSAKARAASEVVGPPDGAAAAAVVLLLWGGDILSPLSAASIHPSWGGGPGC